jgi:hypothetical protein
MTDRLSEADMEQLVNDFAAGTPKRELAKRFGISESSVKRLVRQRRASKPSSQLSGLVVGHGGGLGLPVAYLRLPFMRFDQPSRFPKDLGVGGPTITGPASLY